MNSNAFHIKLADPNLGEAEMRAVRSVLASGRLVKGPRCGELESRLCDITSRRHAIAVSSGSMALLAAMKVLGIGPGATVLVPALTFPAPAFVAAFLGATVRAVDVDPGSFNLSAETVMPHLAGGVDLVVAVDQFGVPALAPGLMALLEPLGIPLLVDAACSLGASLEGAPAGGFGTVSTVSFHPRKVVTTGEGGVVLTDDDALAAGVRRWADQGVENGTFAGIGLNLRLGEINCAIGLVQLERLRDIVRKRRELAMRYHSLPLQFQEATAGIKSNYQTLVSLLPEAADAADRDELIACLRQGGIEATIASFCLGAVPGIRDALNIDSADTPVACTIHDRGLAFPLHPGLEAREIDEVVDAVNTWLGEKGWR
jgi:perosamine synthetase